VKVRIEGCTQQELDDHCGYLTLGTEYEPHKQDGNLVYFMDEHGGQVVASMVEGRCGHLPKGAKWVEVAECCTPTADELKLLAEGGYTPEELWGGSRPTCPKCFGK